MFSRYLNDALHSVVLLRESFLLVLIFIIFFSPFKATSSEDLIDSTETAETSKELSSNTEIHKSEEIQNLPFVTDVKDFVNLQAGIENFSIRGGSIDGTSFLVDGYPMVDNRTNTPFLMPNLSMIEEISIAKSGFSAEYGNLSSGFISIITKDPPQDAYHGSLEFGYSPVHLKHRGPSRFDPENWFVKSYVSEEDSLCWLGTFAVIDSSLWDEYRYFDGWFEYAMYELDTNEVTLEVREKAEALRNLFMWQHNLEGSDALAPSNYNGPPRVRKYGHLPDWNIDAGFGGPIIDEKLGFYASYRQNKEAWALPISGYSDYYSERNAFLKLTSNITKSIKLNLEVMSARENTLAQTVSGEITNYEDMATGEYGINYRGGVGGQYLWAGDAAFNSDAGFDDDYIYNPVGLAPYDVYHTMIGFSLEHSLRENMSYSVKISYLKNERECYALATLPERDTSTVYTITGGEQVTEEPWGWDLLRRFTVGDMYAIGGYVAREFDTSSVKTWNLTADFTTRINKNNEIKIGFQYNYDNMNTYYEASRWVPFYGWTVDWDAHPIFMRGYIQDKVEFRKISANIGLGLERFDPNCEWFELDPYSPYFTSILRDSLLSAVEREPVSSQFKLSPRLGLSFSPIKDLSFYSNFGIFYSRPLSYNMYQIWYEAPASSLDFLGNPELNLLNTTAFEVGCDVNFLDLFDVHLAHYDKKIKDKPVDVSYIDSRSESFINYETTKNLPYEQHIQGLEFKIIKNTGKWFDGWIEYDYNKSSQEGIASITLYDYVVDSALFSNPDSTRDDLKAQPEINLYLRLKTPKEFGPKIFGFKPLEGISLSFLYEWKAGKYQTWYPPYIFPPDDWEYMNQQWKPFTNVYAGIEKTFSLPGIEMGFFVEVNNLFDWKYLNPDGFASESDEIAYKRSLHLPMYSEEPYASDPHYNYTGGNDQFGDIKSDDKPYIDMPNIEDLTFRNPRSWRLGIRFVF